MPLPDLVEDLRNPQAYGHAADSVDVVQTHISYVLLAGKYAYKIKKPLNLGFLDYSTLEQRRRMCEDEVRLNRRLCDGVYLGVVPVTRGEDGLHRVGGGRAPVEWAVKMNRVSDDNLMPSLLESGRLTQARLEALARKIALFHRDADSDDRLAAFGRVAAVRANWDENFKQTESFVGRTLTHEQLQTVRGYVEHFVHDQGALIEERADAGRVRDGHGDLRADSVAFGPDGAICVMDCIEFNERLRCGDIASDVAFLAMDLEYRGHRREADEFVSLYLDALGSDETLPAMLSFYRAYRAFVRGKVDSMLSEEAEVPSIQRVEARRRARRYFDLAVSFATARYPRSVITMVGLPGTGKSFIARALAARCGAVLLSTDAIRRENNDSDPPGRAAYGEAGYTQAQREAVYARMFERAQRHVSLQRSVVLDATFLARSQRARARHLAASAHVPVTFAHTVAPEEVIRDRLSMRTTTTSTSDARWDTYLAQRDRFERLDDVEANHLVSLDSARPLDELVDQAVSALAGAE